MQIFVIYNKLAEYNLKQQKYLILVKFYKSERQAGKATGMFFNREAEGRWGSTLIMMGSDLFFVLGSESQWFVPRLLQVNQDHDLHQAANM